MNTIGMRHQRTSSQQIPPIPTLNLLPLTQQERSIRVYNSRRIRSRNQRQLSSIHNRKKVNLSNLGDIFQAADDVFRSSLAFRRPSQLTLPPRRRQFHKLWKSNLINEEFQQAKTEQIRRKAYASNYKISGLGGWYKGRQI